MIGARAASRRRAGVPGADVYPSLSIFPSNTQPSQGTTRRGVVYWAEVDLGTQVSANRRGRVYMAELETPGVGGGPPPGSRIGRVYWAELEAPSAGGPFTHYLDPNATVSNNWTLSGAASAHLCLDDAVRDPANPTTVGDSASISSSTAGQISHLELSTSTIVGGVTSAALKVYTRNGNKRPLLVELTKADATVLASVTVLSAAAAGWYTATYTGSLTQAEVDGLRAKLTLQSVGGGGVTARIVDAVYVTVIAG